MVQVRVVAVALDTRSQPLILLKPLTDERGTGRVLPIWIGEQEATSIVIAVEGAQPPRPLTHDLMKTVLEAVGTTLERVDVTRIEDGTFYAELTLRTPTGPLVLDSRPSDAIALASRMDAPIWVADEVLEEAGVIDESESESDTDADADSLLDDEKLAEFRQFLDDVDPNDFQG